MTNKVGRHLITTLLLAFLAIAPACTAPPIASEKKPPDRDAHGQGEEDKTVLAVSKAIRTNHLSSLADECLSYEFAEGDAKDFYMVSVRENHRLAKCGGDRNVSPRLFSVKVSKQDGSMSTDQGSTTGEFRALAN